jgi:hypothetical protein
MFKRSLIVLMVLAMALGAAALAGAEEKPDGTVQFATHNIAVGIGVTWGDGTLTYKGKQYKFSIKGLSLVDLGVADVQAKGNVYNLKKLEDFNGDYSSVKAGAAFGKGAQAQQLVNDAQVRINLTAVQEGARLTLAPGGMKITLKK